MSITLDLRSLTSDLRSITSDLRSITSELRSITSDLRSITSGFCPITSDFTPYLEVNENLLRIKSCFLVAMKYKILKTAAHPILEISLFNNHPRFHACQYQVINQCWGSGSEGSASFGRIRIRNSFSTDPDPDHDLNLAHVPCTPRFDSMHIAQWPCRSADFFHCEWCGIRTWDHCHRVQFQSLSTSTVNQPLRHDSFLIFPFCVGIVFTYPA